MVVNTGRDFWLWRWWMANGERWSKICIWWMKMRRLLSSFTKFPSKYSLMPMAYYYWMSQWRTRYLLYETGMFSFFYRSCGVPKITPLIVFGPGSWRYTVHIEVLRDATRIQRASRRPYNNYGRPTNGKDPGVTQRRTTNEKTPTMSLLRLR